MNPFRSRKKSFAEGDTSGRPSLENVPPVPSVPRGRPFRRKKTLPEPKKELDISIALPPSDDFRTSLLMPNLSARFSMLREQDDPNSKIGKANDDSVLFPKRASRLNLFGHEGLSDIAEVSSVSGSFRPPFAENDRAHSYSSADNYGYGTDDDGSAQGNMMTRSKPGMGNKLFGGRQKIYKIPLDNGLAAKEVNGEESGRVMGKPVYDDDVTMSAFQILRAKEKQNRIEAGEYFDDHDDRSSREQDRRDSPPYTGYNRKRETSSSTNSAPMEGRTSTAATSVASQGASSSWYASNSVLGKQSPVSTPGTERPGKGKRLYGHGLDQQMFDQQSSALSRLNSIQRGQGMGAYGAGVGVSRSASNLNDRFKASGPFSPPSSHSGTASPSGHPAGLNGFDFGVSDQGSRSQSKDREAAVRQTPPMSPLTSPVDPTLMAALDANDLGKATASGAFNKPKTQYSEQQFAQRQLQLQEGRETPPPRAYSRTGEYNDRSGRLRNGSLASVQSALSLRNQNHTGPNSRAPSSGSNHGANGSPVEPQSNPNGAFLDMSGSDHGSGFSSPDLPISHPSHQKGHKPAESASQPTIYENEDLSQDGAPQTPERLFLDPTEPTPTSSATISLPEVLPQELQRLMGETDTRDFAHSGELVHGGNMPNGNTSNPTAGLSDLVRGHLRNVSATSATSIYPDSPSNADGGFPPDAAFGHDGQSGNHPGDGASDMSSLQARARQVLAQANQLAHGSSKAHDILGGVGGDKVQQVLGGEAPRRSAETTRVAWQEQLKGHVRAGSTETQKEREDFANELADRRRRVEDNLRTFVDDDSGFSSPTGGATADNSPAKTGPLGLLKKASRGSLAGKNEQQPTKAMKMLGITSAPGSNRQLPPNASEAYSQEHQRPLESREPNRGPNPNRQQAPRQRPPQGNGQPDRNIGAERREKFFRHNSPSQPNFERPGPEGMRPEGGGGMRPQGHLGPIGGPPRTRIDPAHNPPMSYHPAGRTRKYSPPHGNFKQEGPGREPLSKPGSRSNSAMGNRPGQPSGKASNPGSYFPPSTHMQQPNSPNPQGVPPYNSQNLGYPSPIGHPRPSPTAPGFSAHTTPPLEAPPTQYANHGPPTTPTLISPTTPSAPFNALGSRGRKQSVNKHEISEPTFLSGTSSVITVDLPPGASLANGMHEVRAEAPPVPPINPNRRRRIPTTQNVFTAFGNKYPNGIGGSKDSQTQSQPSSAHPTNSDGNSGSYSPYYEERSTFSGDDGEEDDGSRKSSRSGRSRLRKSSSDGGTMATRARHHALLRDADQMPSSPGGGITTGGGAGVGMPIGRVR